MSRHFGLSSKHQCSSQGVFLFLLSLLSLLSLLMVPAFAKAQTQQSQMGELRSGIVKLDVKLDTKTKGTSVQVGDTPQIRIALLDANNKKTVAVRDFKLVLQLKSDSGETIDQKEVWIKQGTSEATIQLNPPRQPGVLEVQVKNPELLEGGTIFGVKAKEKQPGSSVKRPASRARGKSASLAAPRWREAELAHAAKPAAGFIDSRYGDAGGRAFCSAKMQPASYTLAAVVQDQSPAPQKDALTLKLRSNTGERQLKADGKDTASVTVSLSQPAPQDMTIYLSADGGKLDAASLKILKGDYVSTSAQLTSDRAGTARVQYERAEPNIALQPPKDLAVKFEVPITSFGFSVAPPVIPLIDKADIVVRLYDNNNNPVNSDSDREVSFEIGSSIGSLEQKVIKIKTGTFEERTSFVPVARGVTSITAYTTGFPRQKVDLEVTTPVLLLFLTAVGGLLGGLIAYKVKPGPLWRIPTGLITGFILYWACLFSLISYIPRLTVLNQVSALALPVLGGWLGTEVFTILLKRIGVVA